MNTDLLQHKPGELLTPSAAGLLELSADLAVAASAEIPTQLAALKLAIDSGALSDDDLTAQKAILNKLQRDRDVILESLGAISLGTISFDPVAIDNKAAEETAVDPSIEGEVSELTQIDSGFSYTKGSRGVQHGNVRLAVLQAIGPMEIGTAFRKNLALKDPTLKKLATEGRNVSSWLQAALDGLFEEGFLDRNGIKKGGSKFIVTERTKKAYRDFFESDPEPDNALLPIEITPEETLLVAKEIDDAKPRGALVTELVVRKIGHTDVSAPSSNEYTEQEITRFAHKLADWTKRFLEESGGRAKRSILVKSLKDALLVNSSGLSVTSEELKRALHNLTINGDIHKGNSEGGHAVLSLEPEEKGSKTEVLIQPRKEAIKFGPEHIDFAVALVDFIDSERHLQRGFMLKDILKKADELLNEHDEILTKLVLRKLDSLGILRWEKDARTSKSPKSRDLRTIRCYIKDNAARARWRNNRDGEIEKIIDASLED